MSQTIWQNLKNVFQTYQRFNADYELTAREGADTMAYIALLEEKLRPALVNAVSGFPDERAPASSSDDDDDNIIGGYFVSHSCTLSGWMRKTTPI